MRFSPSLLITGLLATNPATGSPLEPRQITNTPCHDVHVFVARGSYEDYPAGSNRQNNLLVPEICKGRPSCGHEDIIYPAVIGNDYCGSQTQGVRKAIEQISAYANRCPTSKIVLTGYSQGAQVIGDIIGGAGGVNACNAGNSGFSPDNSPGNKIVAITLFGDTRRTPGQGYNKGTAGVDAVGAFPRGGIQLDGFNRYAGKVSSYCNAGDQWCSGGSDGAAHENAVEWNYPAAASFINNKL